MKRKKIDTQKRLFMRCVYAMALTAMGFIFIQARAESHQQTYDETFFVDEVQKVEMSLHEYAPLKEIHAGPFTAQRPFILLSAQWDESRDKKTTEVHLRVRTRSAKNEPWSAWMEFERLKDFRSDADLIPGRVRTEPLIVDESREFEANVTLTSLVPHVTPQVANLSFITIGTDNHPIPSLRRRGQGEVRAALNGINDLNIIPRASWGADPSLRANATGQDLWPQTYGEVRAFVVHHTGGTNGGADPATTIRAIQRFHGKILGWGDIGYNYLIAPDGRVFEGREGGEGVVGGHTYNDKKKIGYNTGSIGVAILGNYENKDMLSNAARESLAKLIATKSFEHEIIPDGETTLKDVSIPAVIGHKNIDATICPGAGITTELIRVRQLARAGLEARGGLATIERRATLVGQSNTSLLIKPGQSKTIWVSYRNDGNTSWKNYLAAPVQLADASIKNRLAMLAPATVVASLVTPPSAFFRDTSKPAPYSAEGSGSGRDVPRSSASTVRMAQVVDDEIKPTETQTTPISALTFREPNVAPGETVTIPITIAIPSNAAGIIEHNYVLTWGNKGYFPGTDVHIAIETTEMEWAGKIESLITPTSTRTGVLNQGVVRVRNRGLKTWLKGSVMLLLTDIAGGEPKWNVAGWPLPMGRILSQEATVKPNEVATFPLPLTAAAPGIFETLLSFKYLPDIGTVPATLIETLKLPDLPGVSASFATTVLPSAQIEFIKSKFPTRIRPGRTVYFTLRVKNTGEKTLKGGRAAFLTQTAANGAKSPFYVKSDWISDIEPAYLYQTSLKPRKLGTFTWRMKAPAKKGIYQEKLTFTTADGVGIINGNTEYTFTIKVE
ncbi:MAG: N-acetylmuramoyl-L-alanine amidase [Patescibacteria group bacterium]